MLDWKSDTSPTDADRRQHAGLSGDYLLVTKAPPGARGYMVLGEIVWIVANGEALPATSI